MRPFCATHRRCILNNIIMRIFLHFLLNLFLFSIQNAFIVLVCEHCLSKQNVSQLTRARLLLFLVQFSLFLFLFAAHKYLRCKHIILLPLCYLSHEHCERRLSIWMCHSCFCHQTDVFMVHLLVVRLNNSIYLYAEIETQFISCAFWMVKFILSILFGSKWRSHDKWHIHCVLI